MAHRLSARTLLCPCPRVRSYTSPQTEHDHRDHHNERTAGTRNPRVRIAPRPSMVPARPATVPCEAASTGSVRCVVTVLHPEAGATGYDNERSCVLTWSTAPVLASSRRYRAGGRGAPGPRLGPRIARRRSCVAPLPAARLYRPGLCRSGVPSYVVSRGYRNRWGSRRPRLRERYANRGAEMLSHGGGRRRPVPDRGRGGSPVRYRDETARYWNAR